MQHTTHTGHLMFLFLVLTQKTLLDSPLRICVSENRKTSDPGVKMMRKHHLGSDHISSHAKNDGTCLTQSWIWPQRRTDQVRKLQFQTKHQQSAMCK